MKKISLCLLLLLTGSSFVVAQSYNRNSRSRGALTPNPYVTRPYYRPGNRTPYYGGFNAPGMYYDRGSTNYGASRFYYQPYGVPYFWPDFRNFPGGF